MEKEVFGKIESQISLESNTIPMKEETKFNNECSFWKYLDCTNMIPGEIEVEEEIYKDFD